MKILFLELLVEEINKQDMDTQKKSQIINDLSDSLSKFYSVKKDIIEKDIKSFLSGKYNSSPEKIPKYIKERYVLIAKSFGLKFHRVLRFKNKMYREG